MIDPKKMKMKMFGELKQYGLDSLKNRIGNAAPDEMVEESESNIPVPGAEEESEGMEPEAGEMMPEAAPSAPEATMEMSAMGELPEEELMELLRAAMAEKGV